MLAVLAGEELPFTLSPATDPDRVDQGKLVYMITALPPENSGKLLGTPPKLIFSSRSDYCKIPIIKYEVRDPCGKAAIGEVWIALLHKPSLQGPTIIKSSKSVEFKVFVDDVDFRCVGGERVAVAAKARMGEIDLFPIFLHEPGWCFLRYTPKPSVLIDKISITVTDSAGYQDTLGVLVNVLQPPRAYDGLAWVNRGATGRTSLYVGDPDSFSHSFAFRPPPGITV